jgi:hypothetical protein
VLRQRGHCPSRSAKVAGTFKQVPQCGHEKRIGPLLPVDDTRGILGEGLVVTAYCKWPVGRPGRVDGRVHPPCYSFLAEVANSATDQLEPQGKIGYH